MRKGFLYLVAVMDWHSKKVLSRKLSNTMGADFRVATLEDALSKHGKLDIFNTDQGSQFTSFAFTNVLRESGIRISMDGRARWLDNVFIERIWRSLRYEYAYLHAFETGTEARAGIGRWIDFYNRLRPNSSLGGLYICLKWTAMKQRGQYASLTRPGRKHPHNRDDGQRLLGRH